MKKLLEQIENYYNSQLTPLTDDEKKELDFLKKFTESYDKNNIVSVININRTDLILAIMHTKLQNIPFEELYKDISKMTKINKIKDYKYMNKIIDLIFLFLNSDLLKELGNIPLLSTEDGKIEEIVSKHKGEYEKFFEKDLIDSLSQLHIMLQNCFVEDEEGRKSLFNLINNYTDEFFNALFVATTITQAKGFIKETSSEISKKGCEDIFRNGNLYQFLEEIEERKNILQEKEKNNNKLIRTKDKKITSLKKRANQFNYLNSIKLTEELLEILPDESTKFSLIKKALHQNREIFSQIKPKLKEIDNKEDIEKIFLKYIYDINNLNDNDKELLYKYGNQKQILKIIEPLHNKKLTFYKYLDFPLIDVLLNTNEEIIEYILGLYSQGIINEEFIYNNPEILIKKINNNIKDKILLTEEKYEILKENVELLKQKKLNTRNENIQEILLLNNKDIKETVEILEQYNFPYQKLENFDVLKNNKLINCIDSFIELGIYNILQENPNILNNNTKNTINKILLCRQLNLPLNNDKLQRIIYEKNFKIGQIIIKDDEINEYINNQTYNYENQFVNQILENNIIKIEQNKKIDILEDYVQDNLTYNINGTIISKNKVLRNYEILTKKDIELTENEKIFNAIIHNSNLTEEELAMLNDLFKEKTKKKKR